MPLLIQTKKIMSFNRLIPKVRLLQILGILPAQGTNLEQREHCVHEQLWTGLSGSSRSTSSATALGLAATIEVLMAASRELEGEKRGGYLYSQVRLFIPNPADPEIQMHPSLMPPACQSSGWEWLRGHNSAKHLILQSLEIYSTENIQIFVVHSFNSFCWYQRAWESIVLQWIVSAGFDPTHKLFYGSTWIEAWSMQLLIYEISLSDCVNKFFTNICRK